MKRLKSNITTISYSNFCKIITAHAVQKVLFCIDSKKYPSLDTSSLKTKAGLDVLP
jgi:hypothetical protein